MKQTNEKGKPLTYWGGLEETKHSKVLSENGSELFFDKDGYLVKKEPKPHSFCETPNEKCTMNYCDDNGCQNRKRELVEPKQETTLEKAAKSNYKELYEGEPLTQDVPIDAFIRGAKWQQERSYSEEDLQYYLKKQSCEFLRWFCNIEGMSFDSKHISYEHCELQYKLYLEDEAKKCGIGI